MLLLVIVIQVKVTSELELENKLIGTWKIEKVQINRPGVCIQNNFGQIIGSTLKFTHEHLLFITSSNDWFVLDNGNRLYWNLEDGRLIIKSKNTHRSKITFEKGKLTIQISNVIAIRLVNNLGASP